MTPTGPRLLVVPDAPALGRRAAEHVCASLTAAVRDRGVAHLALTGGTTAGSLYTTLASAHRLDVPWEHVHLWWGDDRFVAFDSPDSNVRLVRMTLLGTTSGPQSGSDGATETRTRDTGNADATTGADRGLAVPAAQIHPFPIEAARKDERGAEWCAEQYARAIDSMLPADERGVPVFDLVLLGVGADGHMLSCFPGSPLVDAPVPPACAAVPAPTTALPAVPRVTCSPRIVESARDVLVIVSGAGKAGAMRQLLEDGADPHEHPAAIAARRGVTWVLDEAAASLLSSRQRDALA